MVHAKRTWSSWRPVLARLAHVEILSPFNKALSSLVRSYRCTGSLASTSHQSRCMARDQLLTSAIVPEFVKAHPFRHLRPHESGMHNADHDASVLQIQTQQLARHVQGSLASVVAVVATALALMAQGDAARLGRDKHDLGALCKQAGVEQLVNDEDGGDGAGGVHCVLFIPVGAFILREVFCREASRSDDLADDVSVITNRERVRDRDLPRRQEASGLEADRLL